MIQKNQYGFFYNRPVSTAAVVFAPKVSRTRVYIGNAKTPRRSF